MSAHRNKDHKLDRAQARKLKFAARAYQEQGGVANFRLMVDALPEKPKPPPDF